MGDKSKYGYRKKESDDKLKSFEDGKKCKWFFSKFIFKIQIKAVISKTQGVRKMGCNSQ